jgi:hypothetical protein
MGQRPATSVAQAILPAQVFSNLCSGRRQDASRKKREMKNLGLGYIKRERSHV